MTRPHFQGKAGKPAVQGSVPSSGLRQRFHGLGCECQTPGTGSLKELVPAPGKTRWIDPDSQPT